MYPAAFSGASICEIVSEESRCCPSGIALQAKPAATSTGTSIRFGTSWRIKRIEFGREGGGGHQDVGRIERAEARIEVIEARVDQLQRDDVDLEDSSHGAVGFAIGSKPVAAEEPVADEERVTGPLERQRARQLVDVEAEALELLAPVRLLPLPLGMVKVAQHRPVVPEHRRVGGEDHVGQTRNRRGKFDRDTEFEVFAIERVPLLLSQRMVDLDRDVHPGIDLVFDAEMVRAAHEHRVSHRPARGSAAVSPSGSGMSSVGEKRVPAWSSIGPATAGR